MATATTSSLLSACFDSILRYYIRRHDVIIITAENNNKKIIDLEKKTKAVIRSIDGGERTNYRRRRGGDKRFGWSNTGTTRFAVIAVAT